LTHPVWEYLGTRSLNNYMADETDPQNLGLPELAQRCEQETSRYIKLKDNNPKYCLELIRRAIQNREANAWSHIHLCYKNLVAHWVTTHKSFESTRETPEYFVNGAFAKFSRAMTRERFEGFLELKPVLGYLKMIVSSLIVDHIRLMDQTNIYSLESDPEVISTEASPEEQVMERASRQELWKRIYQRLQDDRERIVIEGYYVFGLKPREIYHQNPTLFASVDEVYQIQENIILRLRRDLEIKKFRGSVK